MKSVLITLRKSTHKHLTMLYRSGKIFNIFMADPSLPAADHPNKVTEVTNEPEKAYYARNMLALGPLSDI